jgi:Cu2+-exporting ATPase
MAIALVTLLFWWLLSDAGFPTALLHAVSVLIIACPLPRSASRCPAVQVVATGAPAEARDPRAIRRRAWSAWPAADHIAFDKTGTLTEGRPRVVDWPADPGRDSASPHRWPQRAAILRRGAVLSADPAAAPFEGAVEHAGLGGLRSLRRRGRSGLGRAGFLRGRGREGPARGQRDLAGPGPGAPPSASASSTGCVHDAERNRRGSGPDGFRAPVCFRATGSPPSKRSPSSSAIADARGALLPADKLAVLDDWRAPWAERSLMLGDGLKRCAPRWRPPHVSASFTHGVPASQSAADVVLPSGRLAAILTALATGRRATRHHPPETSRSPRSTNIALITGGPWTGPSSRPSARRSPWRPVSLTVTLKRPWRAGRLAAEGAR